MCSARGSCCAWPTVHHWGSERLLIPEFAPMEAPSPFIMWPTWGDCQCTTARSLVMGLFVQNENTAHVNTELVNPCSVTCSPVALQSLLLPFFSVQPGQALCRLSATTTLQTVSVNLCCRAVAGGNLDFWFRHHAGFLWCLRPAVGSVFTTPDATGLNVYMVQNVCPNPTNLLTASKSSYWWCDGVLKLIPKLPDLLWWVHSYHSWPKRKILTIKILKIETKFLSTASAFCVKPDSRPSSLTSSPPPSPMESMWFGSRVKYLTLFSSVCLFINCSASSRVQ